MAAPKTKLQKLLETAKTDSRILGDVQRHLLAEYEKGNDRAQNVIHPSEMAKKDWCHRATYYRMTGDYPHIPPEARDFSFSLENVFEEGHVIHGKWQSRLWDMGVLAGMFKCLACEQHFEALAPDRCEFCPGTRKYLSYVEVPVFNEEHLIQGHSDGEIQDSKGVALLEVKSVGVGTIRFESPELIGKYSRKLIDPESDKEYSYIDYDALWREIRRPLPSHLRQGNIYMFCTGIHRMVYIYEYKFNQQVKEFTVKFQPSIVEPLLDACLDIKWGLEKKRPPACPNNPNGCADCKRYEENDSDDTNDSQEKSDARKRKSINRRQGKAAEGRSDAPGKAGAGDAGGSRGTRRIARRRVDGAVQPVDRVG